MLIVKYVSINKNSPFHISYCLSASRPISFIICRLTDVEWEFLPERFTHLLTEASRLKYEKKKIGTSKKIPIK